MIRGRDRIYGSVVTRRLRAMGIRDKPTAPASPWQNGFAERLIGSIRRECLDQCATLVAQKSIGVPRCTSKAYNPPRINTHTKIVLMVSSLKNLF
jgi:transposase InsO family protein